MTCFNHVTCSAIMFTLLLYCNAYPQGSLQCYSTLTRPDRRLICPEARNAYCVKEVANLPQSLCGLTQYFGDVFVGGQCVYKKCAETCVENEYQFTFDGQTYNRKRYCCNDENLCNGSTSLQMPSKYISFLISILIFLICYIVY